MTETKQINYTDKKATYEANHYILHNIIIKNR